MGNFRDAQGVEWMAFREIARKYNLGNSSVGRWIREMKLETIKLPRNGQGGAAHAIKANEVPALISLKTGNEIGPIVENTQDDVKIVPKGSRKRKERAHMSLHNIKAPFCPFCGARKVANVTTQSLRLCLKCGNVYTVQKFREGPDNE